MSSLTLSLTLVPVRDRHDDGDLGATTAVEAVLIAESDTSVGHRVVLAPEKYGIPATLTDQRVVDGQFQIPDELDVELRSAVEGMEPLEVVWLQLVEPFGYLGLLPWEQLLVERFGVAVARVPSLTLARRRPRDSLQVTLLVAVPNPRRSGDWATAWHGRVVAADSRIRRKAYEVDEEQQAPDGRSYSARDVDQLVRAIVRGSPASKTTVNVVTTPWIYHDLKALWRGRSSSKWPVRLHDVRVLRDRVEQATEADPLAQTPWLRTLRAAQGDEQADVVHLVCHASVTDASTRLVVADPLATSTNVGSRYVSLQTLMSTLDAVGAWALCLTSPPQSDSGPYLRHVATRMAELRPGPILMTDGSHDPAYREVAEGYRCLFASDRRKLPVLRASMLSCEPGRVAAPSPGAAGVTSVIEPAPDEQPYGAAADLMAGDATPVWLAAAQRFVEQRQVDLARLKRDSAADGLSPEAEAIVRGVELALKKIQEGLAETAKRHGGDR
jgi:hypothetical protein